MKSAAIILLELFGVVGKLRPAKAEGIIVSLLHTLNKHGLVDEAIIDIANYTMLEQQSTHGIKYIKSLTSSPEFVGLYNKQKALQLLLQMLPEISLIEETDVVSIPIATLDQIINRKDKSNKYRELKRILKQINDVNLGFYIIQPSNTPSNEFRIIKASNRDEIIKILAKHDLQTPSTLDFLLKGVK